MCSAVKCYRDQCLPHFLICSWKISELKEYSWSFVFHWPKTSTAEVTIDNNSISPSFLERALPGDIRFWLEIPVVEADVSCEEASSAFTIPVSLVRKMLLYLYGLSMVNSCVVGEKVSRTNLTVRTWRWPWSSIPGGWSKSKRISSVTHHSTTARKYGCSLPHFHSFGNSIQGSRKKNR